MSHLDDPGIYSLDVSGMFAHSAALGIELQRAWEMSDESRISTLPADTIANVVVCGVGGSATAGDYLTAICYPTAPVPIRVIRGYALPEFVSSKTLAVVCSYSGETEEALACYDDARRRGATVLVVTAGGRLAERARDDSTGAVLISYRSMPRAALAHGLAPLIRAAARHGLCGIGSDAIAGAAALHDALVTYELGDEVPAGRNGAKQLAEALHGRLPIVMSAEHLAPAALRFKNQLSENAKILAASETLPEANHNFIVGLDGAKRLAQVISLVTLESDLYAPRTQRRFTVTADQFRDAGIPVHVVPIRGTTILEQLMVATAWGDFTSCYLALLQGIDPTPVPHIDALKAALAG